MRNAALVVFAVCFVCISRLFASGPIHLVVELRDGSRAIGTPLRAKIPIKTAYGKFNIPFHLIRSINFSKGDRAATINLNDGERLHGAINLDTIKLETLLGKISVLLADIISIRSRREPLGLEEGLVAYYPFNGNANDESGNDHQGIAIGATLTADRFDEPNAAYSFNGINNYIGVENFPLLNNNFTYSAWIRVTGGNTIESFGILGAPSLEFNTHTWNFTYDNGQKRWDMWDRSNATWLTTDYIDTSWCHVAIIFNGNTEYLFVNGVQKNSRVVNVPIIDGTGRTLYIGCAHSDQPFHGMIDDVQIYNRPLTEEEIHRLSAER